MTDDPSKPDRPNPAVRTLDRLGAPTVRALDHAGSLVHLLGQSAGWCARAILSPRVRMGKTAIVSQIVRLGARSIGIVSLVSGAIGLILALQLAPPLDDFGQRAAVANIISVAVLRELGPLIGAIVLTGFAGAAIAAELGTMVVSEEVEALEAIALSPVRFLVVPRVFATVVSMAALSVISCVVSIGSALTVSVLVLDIPLAVYLENTLAQAKLIDFATGVLKGTVFGLLIGLIACGNGLKVRGGAAGVGRATTATVVESVVAIVIADLLVTTIFYALGLF
ncbi:MAG: ABC transporter permease [Planctomycetota bacterium]